MKGWVILECHDNRAQTLQTFIMRVQDTGMKERSGGERLPRERQGFGEQPWVGPDSAVITGVWGGGRSLQVLPSMFRSAVVLSVPQSQAYTPMLLFAAFLMTSMRFLPSDWKRMFLEGKISLPSLNHLTSAAALLSSQDKMTSSFSTAV